MPSENQNAIGPGMGAAHLGASGTVRRCRADLVLVLGLLSLFLCGPLGIVAWIIANSELRQVRAGLVSCDKVGFIKAGRIFGIIGTALFIISTAVLIKTLPGLLSDMTEIMHTQPLQPKEVAFSGEWHGDRGTVIHIHMDGSADFRTSTTSVKGGRVRIDENSLAIGAMGIYTKWKIERKPFLDNGVWKMLLDGETFSREAEGLLVMDMPDEGWRAFQRGDHRVQAAGAIERNKRSLTSTSASG